MSNISDFINEYGQPSTQKVYRGAIICFLEHIYGCKREGRRSTNAEMEAFEKLADQYITEERDHSKDVLSFVSILRDKPPKTAKVYMAGLKEWLSFNDIEFTHKQAKSIRKGMPKGGARSVEMDMDVLTIRTIISHMDIKGKALILTLASSGMRIGEALSITLEDIHLNEEPPSIDIRGENTKNKNLRFTFISTEAKESLVEWLKVRDRYLEASINKNKGLIDSGISGSKTIDDNRLFPFSEGTVSQIWTNALEKAEFKFVDRGTHRLQLRIHQLRKFFLSQLKLGCPAEIVEALAGHEGYLTEAYRRYTRKQMSEFYIKNEHLLYINMPEDVGKIRTEFRVEMDETNSIVKGLVLENQSLKQMMDNVRQLLLSELNLDIAKTDFAQKLEEFRKKETGLFKITDK